MSFKEFIIALGLLFVTILPITYLNNDNGMGKHLKRWEKIDYNLLEISEYLRRNEDNPLIIMEDVYSNKNYKDGEYINPMTTFTGHYPILSDAQMMIRFGIFEREIMQRRSDINLFYSTDSVSEYERILKRYKISYVIDNGSLKIKNHLKLVKQASPYSLYKVVLF